MRQGIFRHGTQKAPGAERQGLDVCLGEARPGLEVASAATPVNRAQCLRGGELPVDRSPDNRERPVLVTGATGYIGGRLDMSARRSFDVFDPESIKAGCMVFRQQELQARGQLTFNDWGVDGSGEQEYVYQLGEDIDLQSLWEREHKIFDSGTTYIYMKEVPE